MRLLDVLTGAAFADTVNAGPPFTHGVASRFMSMQGSDPQRADSTFRSMIAEVHEKSGPVSAAVMARAFLLSQVRFAWADPSDAASELEFGRGLDRLDRPGAMTRAEMLIRLEQDASYSGNAFLASRRRGPVFRLDPSRVTFAFGSNSEPTWNSEDEMELPFDAQIIALIYNSSDNSMLGSPASVEDLEVFYPGEFAHWKPEPDPIRWWRGQSWITPLIEDVGLDRQISDHQSKFFQHAATPNLVFVMDPKRSQSEVQAYADIVNEKHAGARNAWRNMFLGGAVDVKTVGVDLSKLSLKDVQGGLETRISMRSRVPAVILGAREGLSGSSLNTGNYSAARRLFADGWFSPTIDSLCETLEQLVPPPRNRRMTHDSSKVLFLQEDRKDEAEIRNAKVTAIRTLVDGGFDPASAVATIAPEWSGRLDHAGLLSVQLQEPGATNADARAVMGRLGRISDPELIDPDTLVNGLDDATATAVRDVLDSVEPDAVTMKELRAAMSAALTGVTR